jgi:hypothetical protein
MPDFSSLFHRITDKVKQNTQHKTLKIQSRKATAGRQRADFLPRTLMQFVRQANQKSAFGVYFLTVQRTQATTACT